MKQRFFLIEKQTAQPKGDLFDHCTPKNISGLYTWQAFDGIDPGPQTGGWDRMQLAGNWNLFDLQLWFSESVQVGPSGLDGDWGGGRGESLIRSLCIFSFLIRASDSLTL